MPRPKKDAHPMSFNMDQIIYDRLAAYCEKSGQSKTVAIERAVTMFIDDYEDKMKRLEEPKSEINK